MFTERTSVGLDVHARSVAAAAIDTVTGELRQERLSADPQVVTAWLGRLPSPVATTYEAGPTGFGLARAIRTVGVRCEVAAPSKINRAPGNRVKTDKGDALLLARLLRNDDIVSVVVPTITQEGARDLVRARDAVRKDLMRARHQLAKMLLRHGHVYFGGHAWTGAHDAWMRRIRFDQAGTQLAFDVAYENVQLTVARRDRLDKEIAVMSADSEYTDITRRLCCLRGISTLTGFALAVEIGDWDRLTGASIGSYLGLVPSEHSSGASRRQGGITRTGNSHARRLLIEAAWHHQRPYRRSKALVDRWAQAPAPVVARADLGNQRLYQRWIRLHERNKINQVACAAIARELSGWCWSLATFDS